MGKPGPTGRNAGRVIVVMPEEMFAERTDGEGAWTKGSLQVVPMADGDARVVALMDEVVVDSDFVRDGAWGIAIRSHWGRHRILATK